MSTEPFIGEVKLLGFYFPPLGYMTCSGQLLSISQNTALFSLLGTTFGGDGRVSFGLPDLQGRQPIGQGQGAGLDPCEMGELSGATSVSILTSNLPPHIHTANAMRVQVKAASTAASEQSSDGNYPATTVASAYSDTPSPGLFESKTVFSGTTDATGTGIPVSILNPFLCMNYSIAIEGIFPSRN